MTQCCCGRKIHQPITEGGWFHADDGVKHCYPDADTWDPGAEYVAEPYPDPS